MLDSEDNRRNKDKIEYIFTSLENLNKRYSETVDSVSYHYYQELLRTWSFIKRGKGKLLVSQFRNLFRGIRIRLRHTKATVIESNVRKQYFINEKIAIYTVIYNQYDTLKEPYIVPDNCDFFVITDSNVDKNSIWKKIDTSDLNNVLHDLTNTEKNRFLKMHPHLLFPQYKFSIYIDGSIRVVSDLTPLIYRLGDKKMAFFCHPGRECIYQELKVLKITKKISKKEYCDYMHFLKQKDMPKHFGMVECGLIVREHNDSQCISIMNIWWDLLCKFAKRDQILFPYILFENGYTISEIALLGLNIREYYGIRLEEHN